MTDQSLAARLRQHGIEPVERPFTPSMIDGTGSKETVEAMRIYALALESVMRALLGKLEEAMNHRCDL